MNYSAQANLIRMGIASFVQTDEWQRFVDDAEAMIETARDALERECLDADTHKAARLRAKCEAIRDLLQLPDRWLEQLNREGDNA